ncbi:MAG: sugar phosphate isomerase/epimerase [Chloroflexi bacterium]|nr:MAG: sugar phosphate isomerase/epimerase [Chloroflexota bacterium]
MVTIGVTQWSLDRSGADSLLDAADLGFKVIHIDAGALDGGMLLDDTRLQKAYSEAELESGVKIGAIAPSSLSQYGITSPPGSQNANRCWELMRIAIDAAVQMNVELVFIPSFRASEIHTEVDFERTSIFLRKACEYAASSKLLVATENTLGVDGNLKLLNEVAHPKLRILMDTLNPLYWDHNPVDLLNQLWPHIAPQIHVKDGINGGMGNAILGTGQGNFSEIGNTLVSHGFDGILISENDYCGDRRIFAAQDIAVLNALFQG